MKNLTLRNRDWHHLLMPLMLLFAILGIGLTNLYSATRVAPHGLYIQQLVWITVGFVILFAMLWLDYQWIARWSYAFFGTVVAMLVLVLIAGRVVKGSTRWLSVAGVGLQPSELAKLAIIFALARWLARDPAELEERTWSILRTTLLLLGIPVLLVLKQPDLGTAMLLYLVGTSMMVVAPFPLRAKAWLLLAEWLLGAFWIFFKLHGYQKRRLLTFLNPDFDPGGAGWHGRQAVFAVGSGRIWGKGWLKGTQNQFQFLPEHWTDFPFAVWAEEWGLVGCLVLLVLYFFLIRWAITVSFRLHDRFAQMLAVGVSALLFWHVVLNVGMVVGLLPVVGITLPWVSYGGSSLLTMMVAFGLLVQLATRRA